MVIALVGCRPRLVGVAEPTVYRGCGNCGCWVPREVVEAEVLEAERARLLGPRELLREVAVYRARSRGAEPDTSSQCYGWWRWAFVVGADSARLGAALDAVGASMRPIEHKDTLWSVRAEVGVSQVSELIRSPDIVHISGPPVECGCLTL